MKAQFAPEYLGNSGISQQSPHAIVKPGPIPTSLYLDAGDESRYVAGSGYLGSKRPNPAAATGAILVAATALVSFLYIGGGHHHHHHKRDRLTVVQLADLQPPPPPPPQASKVLPPREQPPEVVSPPPIISVPTAPSAVVTAPQPVPLAAAPGTAKIISPTPAPTVAPVSPSITNAGDLSARMISATPPSYPLDARRYREQGTVVLAVLLSVDGRVSDISISRSSGSERLDHAALRAVRHWRWSPMIRDGSAVLVKGLVTIPFVLT